MARIDGFMRIVQKALPQGSTPSVPLSDDHTDGTWVYTDLYDREIAINDNGEFYYRSMDTIYTFNSATGSGTPGAVGATGATGADGYRAVMNLSYTGSSLTLGTGTITLPITTPINNLGWQQGTRLRVWHSATEYMEGQITSVITNPQSSNIDVNIDYVVGTGTFGQWYVGIAGDLGSGGGGSQTLGQTLIIGNETEATDILLSNNAFTGTSDNIRAAGNTFADAKFSFEDYGGGAWAPTIRTDVLYRTNYITVADTKTQIHNSLANSTNDIYAQIQVEPTQITTSINDLGNGAGSNISLTASEITYSITDSTYHSAIGTIGTEYTTFGNEYISPNPGFPPYHRRGSLNTKSGAASGDETWGEIRSENINGSSYAFIRSTDLGGAYPANIMEVGEVGVDWTTLEHNFNEIKIKSSNTLFYGIQYDQDWSANFTNRSLVDKEYVDLAVAGGGGSTGITYSGSTDYTTFFDSDNSLNYTDTYYNSGRYTVGHYPGTPWIWDHAGKFNVYSPYSTQPAIIAEGGQFGAMFIASDNTAGGQLIGIQSFAHGSQVSGNLGLYSRADGTQSANIGGQFVAYNGVLYPGYTGAANTGVFVDVYSGDVDPSIAGLTNSGIQVSVSGRGGDNNYIGQFQDGSEGAGKVLTCIDGTGLATWQTPTPSGGGGTVSQILTQVRNQSGSTMYRGMVVYISGSTGTLPLVTLSQANSEATSARTYGIIRDDISNNGTGYVVAIGAIQNLDTRTTATNPFTVDTLADGNRLYLSPTTAGYVTNVKPSAPNHIVYIGTVIRTSPTAGYIEYQIQNGYELDEIHDVSITTPLNNDVLTYETSTGLWKNKPSSGSGTTPNLTQVLTQGNTASTDIDMNQYQLQNVSVIDADGDVGIQTINMINASLLTLMYNT